MSGSEERTGQPGEEKLFDDIREFLSTQSVDRIYDDLAKAYAFASAFVERELRGIDEYERMMRGLEKLVDDIFEGSLPDELRAKTADVLYLYGLAHYSLMQQVGAGDDDIDLGDEQEDAAKPLVIYDVWFPGDIAIERADDGLYLHISDGRIDISLYLGVTPNERGALVDLVDHWGYAASNVGPVERDIDVGGTTPMLTIEIDYGGSELVDAHDHVDVLFFDDEGEPLVRMHARASDLRAIVDELQSAERDGGL
ncbi:MAG TPA: hypothetical protein VMM78_16605 [Thermomicrobiales bacterium]|nr:hypothetical protein [Thermomicrobiales bacterium]